jgi:hypothetical protein
MTPVPMHGGFSWQAYNEEPSASGDSTFTMVGLLEQINTTRDVSDYLWYMTEWVFYNLARSFAFSLSFSIHLFFSFFFLSFFVFYSRDDFLVVFILVLIFSLFFPCSLDISSVHIDPSEGFLRSGKYPVLGVLSAGHALHVFINGQLSGRFLFC